MRDISLHIIDILQNAINAKASVVELSILKDVYDKTLTLLFTDNGYGMDEKMVQQAVHPFFTTRTTRKTGLGLSLLKQNAEQTGGSLSISSKPGHGTAVKAVFNYAHIDCKPMGDIAGALLLTISSYPDVRFLFHYQDDNTNFVLDTDEVKKVLDGISMQNPQIVQYLKEMVEENLPQPSIF